MTILRKTRLNLVIGVLAAMILFLIAGLSTSFAADWPCYRGPNKDGRTAEGIASWPPKELWRANVGQGYSQVVVSQGRVYTMGWAGGQDHVWCFNESSTGTNPAALWEASYAYGGTYDGGYPGTRSTPTVDGNEVYTYSADGQLKCFNKTTGSNVWNRTVNVGPPGWGFASAPLVEGNSVIVNAGSACIAIDKSTLLTNWSSTGSAGYASPYAVTVGTQRTVVVHSGSTVSGVDPSDGSVLWYFSYSGGGGLVSPIVYNNQIWASKANGMGQAGFKAMNLGSGQLASTAWENTTDLGGANSSILKDGYIYGLVRRGSYAGLGCIEFSTGNMMWNSTNSASTRFGLLSGIVVAGDEVVIVTGTDNQYDGSGTTIGNGYLIVASATPSGYTELHRATIFSSGYTWISPTLANGRLYLRSQDGTLICYDVSYSASTFSNCIPPANWIDHYYAGTNNYTNAAASDTDGDRMTAWQEYLAGTDPTNKSSCLSVGVANSNGNVIVTYPTLAATDTVYAGRARYYGLESATNLLNAIWQPVPGATNVLGNNATVVYTNASPNPLRFYRARARVQ